MKAHSASPLKTIFALLLYIRKTEMIRYLSPTNVGTSQNRAKIGRKTNAPEKPSDPAEGVFEKMGA